jgi:dihydrofolate reductase
MELVTLPFKAIAAMAENRVIGRGADIPWHLPEDFKFFKRTTTGHVLVMGRKTFESIGRPLPGRETIVLSRRGFSYPGVRCVSALGGVPTHSDGREVFICGGAEIYRQSLPLCSELFLTHVKRTVEGDALFPEFETAFHRVSALMETPEFEVVLYRNNQLA